MTEDVLPKISVIMGVYNMASCEDILHAAIKSILEQSYKDFEFIICDDGSSDDTYSLLQGFSLKDSRIVLLQNKCNIGLAATLNKCIKYAKGKFIARMDSDDMSDKLRLEKELDFLEKHTEFAMVGSCVNLFSANGVWGIRDVEEYPAKKSFLFNSPFVHPSIMMRKKVFVELGGYRVAKETLRAEDYDLFMRLYALGYRGYNLQENLLSYREDDNAYKKRKYKYRIDETIVRYIGFKKLGLLPRYVLYVVKPLIVGLVPQSIINKLKYR